MLFPTIRFAIFYLLVLPTSWLLMPRPLRWRLFMVVASFAFYGAWDWGYTVLLAASIVGNHAGARWIEAAAGPVGDRDDTGRAARRGRRVAITVAANLAVLGFYKYAGFLGESSGGLLAALGLDLEVPAPDVVLPVGISFFTFQALSYVIDVHRERLQTTSLLDLAVYLSFFPHLVAGPIVRASEFLPQLRHRRDPRRVAATLGLWLIAAGLVKKVVVSSYLAEAAVDPLFALPGEHGGLEALVGVYAYAIQIYADFSGYTDMAIGLALLLGFRFPANFDAPYSATSLRDFWRRWHMTLSRWLRDYLYVPLGGNRGRRWRTYRNLALTMVLGGLWHGAAWTFVVWGALHGAGLAVERWFDERRAGRRGAAVRHPTVPDPSAGYGTVLLEAPVLAPSATSTWTRRIVTFNLVCVAWVFFRADSLDAAVEVLGRIVGGAGEVAVNPVVVLVVVLMLAAQHVPAEAVGRLRAVVAAWPVAAQAAALASVLLVVDALGPTGVAPFIYFQF
ncbi:MAG: MBOAT family protein [Acidimicrobiia bacterium]|nr:MBOAT family protein [Acidimicrobiia bacterium]